MELLLPPARISTLYLLIWQCMLVSTALGAEAQVSPPEPNSAFKGKHSSQDVLQKHQDVGASKLMFPNALDQDHQMSNVIPRRARREAANLVPTVRSIDPSFGPAQGTVIFLKGGNLGRPNVTVMVGSLPCLCRDNIIEMLPYANLTEPACNTDNEIACTIENGTNFIGQALKIRVTTADGTEATIVGNISFTFRPNPVILSVWPRTQYIAGGRRVNVTGENLDSGFQATLFLTTYQNGNTIKYNRKAAKYNSEPCILHSSTVMECITRRADVPRSYQIQRKKREANGEINTILYINDPDLTIRINIEIGYMYAVDLFEELGAKGIMYVAKDPDIDSFPDFVYSLHLYKEEDPSLIIHGRRLTFAAEKKDYNVTVGGAPCVITDLSPVTIKCMPPRKEDIPPDGRKDNNGNYAVRVEVGNVHPLTPGTVRYISTKPVDPIPIIAGVLGTVGLILIVIAVFLIVWQRKKIQRRMR